jgi:hypothetical protein
MLRGSLRWTRLVVLGLGLGAGAFAGLGHVRGGGAAPEQPPAALSRAARASDALPAAVLPRADSVGVDTASTRRIAPSTYIARRREGMICVVSTWAGMSMSCNPAASFFHGQPLVFGVAEQGSPVAPTAARVAGIAREEVASVRLILGTTALDATPSADGGFVIDATPTASPPTALEALDRRGDVLATYRLPTS